MENIFVVKVEVDYEGNDEQYVYLEEGAARTKFEEVKTGLDRGKWHGDWAQLVAGRLGESLEKAQELDSHRPDEDVKRRRLMLGVARMAR